MREGAAGGALQLDWIKVALAFVALVVATILAASTSYCYRYFLHTRKQILQAYNQRRSPRVLEEMVGLLHPAYWTSPVATYEEVKITIPDSRYENITNVFKWTTPNMRWQFSASVGR